MTKKVTTLLAALAIAITLSAPAFAKKRGAKTTEHGKAQVLHAKKKAFCPPVALGYDRPGKAHVLQAKKKGTMKGKKKGQ